MDDVSPLDNQVGVDGHGEAEVGGIEDVGDGGGGGVVGSAHTEEEGTESEDTQQTKKKKVQYVELINSAVSLGMLECRPHLAVEIRHAECG